MLVVQAALEAAERREREERERREREERERRERERREREERERRDREERERERIRTTESSRQRWQSATLDHAFYRANKASYCPTWQMLVMAYNTNPSKFHVTDSIGHRSGSDADPHYSVKATLPYPWVDAKTGETTIREYDRTFHLYYTTSVARMQPTFTHMTALDADYEPYIICRFRE